MSDPTLPEQSGNEGATAPQDQTFHSERDAVGAIEGLLDFGDAGDDEAADTESGASAQDDGSDEGPTTVDEEGESEQQSAAIAPPNSWSAEDKALFSKLPPEAQAVVARRESEREAQFTRRTQEIAEERKGWETERAAIATQRQQYQQSLNQLFQVVVPEVQAFGNIDWTKLAAENPAEYVRLSAARDQTARRLNAVQAEAARIAGEAQQEQARQTQAYLAQQKALLVERVPDFADPVKAPQLTADLTQHLQSKWGFTPEEIASAKDSRVVAMAVENLRFHQAQAARKTAQTKTANVAPVVQKPGAAPASAADGQNRRMKDSIARFGRSNSERDAAAILEAIL